MYLTALSYIHSKGISSKYVLFLVSERCDLSRLNDTCKRVSFNPKYYPVISKIYLYLRFFLFSRKLGRCNFYVPFYTEHSKVLISMLDLNSIRIIEEGELGYSVHLQKERELKYFPTGFDDFSEFIVTELDSFPKIERHRKFIVNPLKIKYPYKPFFKDKVNVVLFPAVHRVLMKEVSLYIEMCLSVVKPPLYIKLHPTWYVTRFELEWFLKILSTIKSSVQICPNSVILELESSKFVNLFGPKSSMERIANQTGHLYTRLTFFDKLY
jgi:hypothetical protein